MTSPCFQRTISWRGIGQAGPAGSSHGGYGYYYIYGYRYKELQKPPKGKEVSE